MRSLCILVVFACFIEALTTAREAFANPKLRSNIVSFLQKHYYEGNRSSAKEDIEKQIVEFFSPPQFTRKPTEEEKKTLYWFTSTLHYQFLIDDLFCIENASPEAMESISPETLESTTFEIFALIEECRSLRRTHSRSLYKFIHDYSSLSTIDLCLIKHRMLLLEAKFSPYEFMCQKECPHAYDAEAALQCVRERL